MKDCFRVRHVDSGHVYTLTRCSDRMYRMTWKACGTVMEGYNIAQELVEAFLENGRWIEVIDLPEKFVVYHAEDTNRTYLIEKVEEGMYRVSWDERPAHNFGYTIHAGCCHMHEDTIRGNIERGVWKIEEAVAIETVPQNTFAIRLAYFETHIAAVEENLASLKAAFEELKRSA